MTPEQLWWQHLERLLMVPLKVKIVQSDKDVTGEERFVVIAEGLVGEKKGIVKIATTLAEAVQVAERCPESAVSIWKQVGYGFREETR